MGWTDSHLHAFEIADCQFGIPDPDWPDDMVSEKRVTLAKAVAGKKTFHYVYDFGDNWEHKIKVEKILPPDASLRHPICLDGANALASHTEILTPPTVSRAYSIIQSFAATIPLV